MNINNVLKPAQQFLSNNLATGDDFGNVKPGRDEAKRVDTEVGRINADTVDVRASLDTLQDDSQLKPPTFADVSNKQVMMGAVSAGTVAGGAIGVLTNLTAGGSASVDISEQVVPIYQEKLDGVGFSQKFYTVGGTPQNPEGFELEEFRQLPLTRDKVGEYTQRTASVSGSSNIAMSGLIGAGIGAGVGALTGGAILLGRKMMKAEYNGAAPRETEGDNKLIIAGGIAGAAIGGVAGGLSSVMNSTTTTYETESIPTMNTEVLGQMPKQVGSRPAYIPAGEISGQPSPAKVAEIIELSDSKMQRRGIENLGSRDIEGQVPQRSGLPGLKTVTVNTEDKTVNVGPGLMSSVVGGMAVGAVTGVAGGVLVNVLRKTL